jgi:hypothetical protein
MLLVRDVLLYTFLRVRTKLFLFDGLFLIAGSHLAHHPAPFSVGNGGGTCLCPYFTASFGGSFRSTSSTTHTPQEREQAMNDAASRAK